MSEPQGIGNNLAIEYRPVEGLIPYARNARTHSEAQVAEIAGSIRSFGFANPILVGDDYEVIAGHGRLAAARLLGLKEVPVIVLKGLNEFQRRQLVLADNRIQLNAAWDADMLKLELTDLSALGADLESLGFTEKELDAAMTGGVDPDTAPKLDGLSYSVVVRCKDEAHQGELLAKFEREGLSCEALIS